MRLLHTSDWHLGRSFHGEALLGAQADFVDHLLEVVEAEEVDLVVLAGDVYDRALPPVDAVQLADETFARLAASRARVVLTSGNHDSARRLGFGSRLIDAAGVHVRTDPARVAEPVLLEDAHGPVAVYGLPFLEPDLLAEPWGLANRSHAAAIAHAMGLVRADLAGRPGTRSVVLAHAFVAGGEPSDSERDISVGGVSLVPVPVLDGVDYVALGHLHGRATLTDRVRYCGSPLAYSFSEASHRKGSWLVDLAADGAVTATFVDAPVPRPLALLRGTLEHLLTAPSHEGVEGAWLHATLTDPVRPAQAMERLRRRFPHAVSLAFEPEGAPLPPPRRRAAGASDLDIALDFVRHVRELPATEDEAALLSEALSCCPDDADLRRERVAT